MKSLINHVAKVETYQLLAANGRPIRKATKCIFSDGYEVKFLDYIPSKTDAINAAIGVRLTKACDSHDTCLGGPCKQGL